MGTPKRTIVDANFAMVGVLFGLLVRRQEHVYNFEVQLHMAPSTLTSVDDTPWCCHAVSRGVIARLQCQVFP